MEITNCIGHFWVALVKSVSGKGQEWKGWGQLKAPSTFALSTWAELGAGVEWGEGFGPVKGSRQVLQWVTRRTHELIKMQTVLLPSSGWRPGVQFNILPWTGWSHPRE